MTKKHDNSTPEFGAIVVRREVDNRKPWEVGDEVTTYLLGEPNPFVGLPRHSGCTKELVAYEFAVLSQPYQVGDWRVRQQLKCTCHRVIAELQMHLPTKRLWVTWKPERVPAAFRTGATDGNLGSALHGRAGEAPHVCGPATCKGSGCGQRWLVVSFVNHAALVKLSDARHGGKIVE